MKHVFILCNALDDDTRLGRAITTDSPAGSNKVFSLAGALRSVGVPTTVLSYGRGRRSGGPEAHATAVRRVKQVPTVYLRFVNRPLLSELVSVVAAALAVVRLHRHGRREVLVAYNRAPLNGLALVAARLVGMRVVLDLEDGFSGGGARAVAIRLGNAFVDALCDRALLACTALAAATRLRPVLPYHGAVGAFARPREFDVPMTALLGGTLNRDTGAEWLADAIEQSRRDRPPWTKYLVINITGKGRSLARLASLAGTDHPAVRVWGRTTDAEYAAIRARASIGLSLRPPAGAIADTTFPSKTIDMSSAGQVVVTTDVSDVRSLLGDHGAVYIRDGSVAALTDALRRVVERPAAAAAIAACGADAVAHVVNRSAAGARVAEFLFADWRRPL